MAVLFFIVFIDLVGFGMIIPLLPFYAEHFGADPFIVGLVMGSYSLAQFAAAPFWGRLSDRVGRRPVLIVSLAGAAVAYVWLGYADKLWILFAARIAGGAMAGNISAAFAYMADITTPENRAKGMGLIGAAFGLGFIAGPALGGLLAGSDPALADYRTPALAAAGLSFLALGMSFAILKESLSPEVRQRLAEKPRSQRWAQFRAALARPRVGGIIGLTFLATFVFAGMEATFALWSNRQFGWGPAQNGYLFAFIGILSATIQGGFIGRLAKKFGEARLIIFGTGALAIGLGLIPLSTSIAYLLVAMIFLGIGFSVMSPSLNSLVSLQVGAEDQGGIMGVNRSANTLARVLGPAWAGFLFATLGRNWPYFGGALLMAMVFLLAARGLKPFLTKNEPPKAGD